jgi:hypothetical protein
MSYTLPLKIQHGHMFVRIGDEVMLLDTGAPNSFGSSSHLTLAGKQFSLADNYLGLTTDTLSSFVGIKTTGLIGADILGVFDLIIDAPRSTLTLSAENLTFSGNAISLDLFMGIPIISVDIGDNKYRMFFDTGAQISYFEDDSLTSYPSAGQIKDFYPGIGQFITETYTVDLRVGECTFGIRCGKLPELLALTLMMAGTQGILGNQFLHDRTIGYFPRRKALIL